MATTFRNKKNHPLGVGTLNTAIDDNDLTIILDAGQGASFPSATFTISIDEEIILIDSRSTDTLTVNASGRGYDSSTASAHAAGVAITNNQIVKDFTDCETAINGIENGTTTLAKVISSGSAANSHTVTDAGTNTVVSLLELYHLSSGTPAAGLGAKLILGAEDAAGTATAAMELHGYLTDVTDGSEDGAFKLRLMTAGTIADALTVALNSMTFYDDTDSTAIFGRCRLASATSDRAQFAHRDRSASNQYALSHTAGGDLQLNGASSIAFQIAASTEITLSATDLTFSDAFNLIFNATTGTKIGTATSQKIGFWNATPIIQPASANQAALSLDVDVTGGDTVDKAAINTNFTNIQTLVNQLRTDMVAAGIIKGAA